jgi:hypothetical protein
VWGTSVGLGGTGPLPLLLEPAAVDMFARCWVAGPLLKVGCSEVLTMVWRI